MINIIAALELAAAAASKESPIQIITDAKILYGVYQDEKAGKLDIAAMSKSGELKTVIDATARTTAVASAIMADPASAQHVATLLESIA